MLSWKECRRAHVTHTGTARFQKAMSPNSSNDSTKEGYAGKYSQFTFIFQIIFFYMLVDPVIVVSDRARHLP